MGFSEVKGPKDPNTSHLSTVRRRGRTGDVWSWERKISGSPKFELGVEEGVGGGAKDGDKIWTWCLKSNT